jgi:hypothetical protein
MVRTSVLSPWLQYALRHIPDAQAIQFEGTKKINSRRAKTATPHPAAPATDILPARKG